MRIQKVARKSMEKNRLVDEEIKNKITAKRNAASTLQAAIKRKASDKVIQNKILKKLTKENSLKSAIKPMHDVYVIPKFKTELDKRAVTPLEQAALADNSKTTCNERRR